MVVDSDRAREAGLERAREVTQMVIGGRVMDRAAQAVGPTIGPEAVRDMALTGAAARVREVV